MKELLKKHTRITRKVVTEEIRTVYDTDILIIGLEAEYSDYANLRIVTERDYDDGVYLVLLGDRLETDEEVRKRLVRSKAARESKKKAIETRKKNDFKELERLKKEVHKLEAKLKITKGKAK